MELQKFLPYQGRRDCKPPYSLFGQQSRASLFFCYFNCRRVNSQNIAIVVSISHDMCRNTTQFAGEEPSSRVQQRQNVKRKLTSKAKSAIGFAQQPQCHGLFKSKQENDLMGSTQLVEAEFVITQDSVIAMTDGGHLPALKLNQLRDEVEGRTPNKKIPVELEVLEGKDGANMKYGFLIIRTTTIR